MMKSDIEAKLEYYKVKIDKYKLHEDGVINVDGDVQFGDVKCDQLPLKFGTVNGSFLINFLDLKSLEGCPYHVAEDFYCFENQLTTLVGCPKYVGGDFDCSDNQLTTIHGLPDFVGNNITCVGNQLTTLEGLPTIVTGDLACYENPLDSLVGIPKEIKKRLYIDRECKSLFFGNLNLKYSKVHLIDCANELNVRLPQELIMNSEHIDLILKYQHLFDVWNSDFCLNTQNFQVLIEEICDGLL